MAAVGEQSQQDAPQADTPEFPLETCEQPLARLKAQYPNLTDQELEAFGL